MSPHIHVVDGDRNDRSTTVLLVRSLKLTAFEHDSAGSFSAHHDPDLPSCAILSRELPDRPALELHREIAKIPWCRVIVVGHRLDVQSAVAHMRLGAVDVLEKSSATHRLQDLLIPSLRRAEELHAEGMRWRTVDRRLSTLSEAERDVLHHLVRGSTTKAIAVRVDVSERTIERRRTRIFEALGVNSTIELARLVTQREQWTHDAS